MFCHRRRVGSDGTQKIHQIWAGDVALEDVGPGSGLGSQLEDQTGDGNFEKRPTSQYLYPTLGSTDSIGGYVEFLNGNTSQLLVETTVPYNPLTNAGELALRLWRWRLNDPGLSRAAVGVLLRRRRIGASAARQASPRTPSRSRAIPRRRSTCQKVGDDCNPADVIWRILTAAWACSACRRRGSTTRASSPPPTTLNSEGHGYSRAITDHINAQELLADVLRQIDGVLFVHPLTGLITIKLVRYDYNSRDVPTISPDNCERLENFDAGSLVGLPNKIRVTFTDRAHEYSTGSAQTHSFVAAVGQSAQGAEIEKTFLGCHTQELADTLAARELEAESRPLTKCSAIVSRDFWLTCPGDVVRLVVARARHQRADARRQRRSRRADDSNSVRLDLIQEFFQVHRFESDGTGPAGPPGG
jgi:hypothetical protein